MFCSGFQSKGGAGKKEGTVAVSGHALQPNGEMCDRKGKRVCWPQNQCANKKGGKGRARSLKGSAQSVSTATGGEVEGKKRVAKRSGEKKIRSAT